MKFKVFSSIYALLYCSLLSAQIIDDSGFKKYEHINSGCPINSLCSKKSGLRILEWERLIGFESGKVKNKKLQNFFKNNGIPVYFLSKKSLRKKQDVVLNSSRCKSHNPKNPNNALYRGQLFTTKISPSSQILFDKIHVFSDDKKFTTFHTSYESRPTFIKNGRLFFLEDYDDSFYQISVSQKGDLRLENLPQRLFSQAQSKRIKEVSCPKSKQSKPSRYLSTYCQKIWDIDTNKMRTIQVFWSCP